MKCFPVVGFCGYSGSGKTTLIESLVRYYRARGLRVGVIKQEHHDLELDREGKDSDRLFRAGADVMIRDTQQCLLRRHRSSPDDSLHDRIRRLVRGCDLILVEGHKTAPLPRKLWLCRPGGDRPPPEAVDVHESLPWDADRTAMAISRIDAWLDEILLATPLYGGILIGGASRRMGRPKHLIMENGRTWLEHLVSVMSSCVQQTVLLGAGTIPDALRELPVLPDVPDGPAGGPLRGMRAAMRWSPDASWLFTACDQPCLSVEALAWLLSRRRPGVRAVMPRLPGQSRPEPLPAWYDFRMAGELEHIDRPSRLGDRSGVEKPTIPPSLAQAWRNLNTPADLACAYAAHPDKNDR